MNIPLIDLTAQYKSIQAEIEIAIQRVLNSSQFILGPEVSLLEDNVANYLGVTHAIGVASGTDALILTLRGMGIGRNDEVIVPAYTFFATVGAVLHLGAIPVFVDIDETTYCIDVDLIEQKITSKTKAIIPVHLYGHPANMRELLELASKYSIKVIEDNAQAFGADYYDQKTGSLGDAACLSFFPSKNLGAYGDGGMIVTNDEEIADKVRMLRTHGWQKKYFPEQLGYNSRLDSLQAAILQVKLRHVDAWNIKRKNLAQEYNNRLKSMDIQLPIELPHHKHIYHLFVIRHGDRDRIRNILKISGIQSSVYYPQPPYLADPCRKLNHKPGDFPFSDQSSKNSFAIPLYPEMTDIELEFVVDNIIQALNSQ